MTRVAVVGHTEWIEFVAVERQPPRGGLEEGRRLFEHAGSSAVAAAVVLARLGAEVDFYTALGDDERARRAEAELVGHGVTVHAARRAAGTRSLFATLDPGGERTIVTVGERLAPRRDDGLELGPLRTADAVYATAGDAGLLAIAARTPALVVTTRIGAPAEFASVDGIDVAVFSASDPGETTELDGWADLAAMLVATEGAAGGHWHEGARRPPQRGRWSAAPLPGPARDSFGCGDAFAAGLTFGLAQGGSIAEATAAGARAGAEMLTRVGAP
jgi:ribokinase